MKSILKHSITYAIFLILFSISELYSQSVINIDYYGVVANEVDENMYKMTSDLYYTQLCEIPLFSITDKRTSEQLTKAPSKELFSKTNLSFYAVIEKKDETKWLSTLIVINTKNESKQFQAKEYDSYYKILTEPKTVLQETLKSLLTQNNKSASDNEIQLNTAISSTTTELLSGTWNGEEVIDKIVIMRGGRGFVIFKNGASMNITVEFDEQNQNKIKILQNAKSNASFFPEIPRQTALKAAVNANPIQWNLEIKDNNTLTGTKNTLVLDSSNNITEGTVNVTWTRR